jgi:hypothetical protein
MQSLRNTAANLYLYEFESVTLDVSYLLYRIVYWTYNFLVGFDLKIVVAGRLGMTRTEVIMIYVVPKFAEKD